MTPIALLADTHMPKGARRLPQRCIELISGAEALIHAGDFTTVAVLEELERLCPVVHAVQGNVDEGVLRRTLPVTREVSLGDKMLAVVHDAGPARGRLERLRERFSSVDAVLFGHSHLPLHEKEGDFQIFNPGSPTERRRAPRRSMGMLHVEKAGLRFEHVWI